MAWEDIVDFATSDFAQDTLYPSLVSLYAGSQQQDAVSSATNQQVQGYQQGIRTLQNYGDRGLNTLRKTYQTGMRGTRPYYKFGVDGIRGYRGLMRDPSSIVDDPGYEFVRSQGEEAFNRSSAAKRNLLSGGNIQGLINYNQDYASTQYDNALKRYMDMVGVGEKANQVRADLGRSYAGGIAGIYRGLGEGISGMQGRIGETYGAGTLGEGAAQQGQLDDILSVWQNYRQGKKVVDLVSGAKSAAEQLTTAGGGSPASAIYGEGGIIDQYGAGTWGDLSAGPNTVTSMSSLYAAPGSTGEFAAFGDAPFEMISEYGIGANPATGSTASNSLLSGINPMLKTLGIAGAVLGGVKFLDSINWGKGGASNSTKVPKFMQRLRGAMQADPTGRKFAAQLDGLVSGKLWAGEENRQVVQELLSNGVIDYDYAKLHGKHSIYNLWDVSPENIAKRYEYREQSGSLLDGGYRAGYYQTRRPNDEDPGSRDYYRAENERMARMHPSMIKAVQGAYGLTSAQAKRYANLVSITNRGPMEDTLHDVTPGEWQQAIKQREAFEKNWLTEDRKLQTAKNLFRKIRANGYKGNLSKLTQYINSAR